MTRPLFETPPPVEPWSERLGPGAVLLHGFALAAAPALLDAAAQAGLAGFLPEAGLINRDLPDTRLSLHQDRDERDLTVPIVSVSLGRPALFLWGGLKRKDPTCRFPLAHGEGRVGGGPDRLRDHGVRPLQAGQHPLLGEQRLHLTFRQAG